MAGGTRILVRVPNWLGDCIMALPTLRALRLSCPDAKIDVAVRPHLRACFEACEDIDGVVECPKKSGLGGVADSWKAGGSLKGKYDCGVLLTNSFSSALWLWRSSTPKRIGVARDGRGILLTDKLQLTDELAAAHQADYYLRIAALCGAGIERAQPELKISEAGIREAEALLRDLGLGDNFCVAAPTSAYGPVKDWPAEKYSAVAARIVGELGLKVAIAGTGADAEACEKIAEGAGDGVCSIAGKTGLAAFMAVIGKGRFFLGGDSGGAHVAAAMGKPAAVIFGITEPSRTCPLGEKVAVIGEGGMITPKLDDPQVRTAARAALEKISADEVFDVCKSFVERAG